MTFGNRMPASDTAPLTAPEGACSQNEHVDASAPPAAVCDACLAVGSRRDFLREGAGLAAVLLASLGASPARAAAIPVRWWRGVASGEDQDVRFAVPANDGVTIDRGNELILVRWQRALYAFALSCPHQRTMLKWLDADQRFQCPKHKSKYQPDGTFISGRATRGMDRYPLRIESGSVIIHVASPIRQDQDPIAWSGAVAHLA